MKWTQCPQSKSRGNLNRKHRPSLARLEEYIQKPKWSVKDQVAHLNCPQPNLMQSLHHQEQNLLWEWIKSNAQGSTKSLQRSYSIESMDSNTDCIVVNLDLGDIANNYKTWNHLAVCKQMNSIPLLNVTYKPST